ncbi:MAG: ABC transporter ATP-binding protein, partial [bacterium]
MEKGGENISNGEKQIINILRIIFQPKQIIVLDEATSNLDPVTDKIIAKIFKDLKNTTIILITHRLELLK